jgi:methyltransferase
MRLRVPAWYLGVVAAAAGLRLAELALSAEHERGTRGHQAAERSYPLMVAIHTALFTLPLLEVAAVSPRRPRPMVGFAAVTLAGATLLRWWSIWSLGRAWNVRAVVPDELEPVERGPYGHIRHPNYVAVALEMAALPLLGGAWRSAIALSVADAAVLAHRIRAEELLLDANLTYRRRFAGKPRFIPKVF